MDCVPDGSGTYQRAHRAVLPTCGVEPVILFGQGAQEQFYPHEVPSQKSGPAIGIHPISLLRQGRKPTAPSRCLIQSTASRLAQPGSPNSDSEKSWNRAHQSAWLWSPAYSPFDGQADFPSCKLCRRPKLNPWVRAIPWRRGWLPTPVFLPGEFHGRRSLMGYSPWGHKGSDMTEQLTPLHFTSSY